MTESRGRRGGGGRGGGRHRGREWIVLDAQTMLRKLHCTVLCGRSPFSFLFVFSPIVLRAKATVTARNSIADARFLPNNRQTTRAPSRASIPTAWRLPILRDNNFQNSCRREFKSQSNQASMCLHYFRAEFWIVFNHVIFSCELSFTLAII